MTGYTKDIKTISELLKSCYVAFDDSLYLNDLLVNKKEYVANLQLLNRSYDAIFAQLIIDLYKLSKNKEDYSIPKLLNKLINNYKNVKWQNSVTVDDLRQLQCEFETEFNTETLNQICDFRDWYFAHLDRKRQPISISHKRVRKQLALLERSINKISYGLQGRTYIFTSDEFRENLGYNIENYHKLRDIIYDSHAKGIQNLPTDQLLQLVRERK